MVQRHLRPLIVGKERGFVVRSEIGIDRTAGFVRWIGCVAQFSSEVAIARFRRRLQHVAVDVVFPAVINTAQAALLVAAEIERRSAVSAAFADQADAALTVAEGYQFLA